MGLSLLTRPVEICRGAASTVRSPPLRRQQNQAQNRRNSLLSVYMKSNESQFDGFVPAVGAGELPVGVLWLVPAGADGGCAPPEGAGCAAGGELGC